jgi:hypothetical protein
MLQVGLLRFSIELDPSSLAAVAGQERASEPEINRSWPAWRQGSGEFRLVTVEINARSSPSSQPCIGLWIQQPHAATYAGSQVAGRINSPSCTGVGVVKFGRGGSTVGVSRPGSIGIRTSPPDSGVVPFSFEKLPAPIRAPINFSGRLRFAAWIHDRIRVPTSLEPRKRTIETTMPTGLAVSRGQF